MVLTAVASNGRALRVASGSFRQAPDVVLAAVRQNGQATRLAADELRDDMNIVRSAFAQDGTALKHASDEMRDNRTLVLEVVASHGMVLEFVSTPLRGDREVAKKAISNNGASLKFVAAPLSAQDPELIELAGLQAKLSDDRTQVTLSVRFGLRFTSSPVSSDMNISMAKHNAFKGYRLFNPNTVCMSFCGPGTEFVEFSYPCRGLCGFVCVKIPQGKECKNVPKCETFGNDAITTHTCWRRSLRSNPQRSKDTAGLMVQGVEWNQENGYELGAGQAIETALASIVGLKTFRIQVPRTDDGIDGGIDDGN